MGGDNLGERARAAAVVPSLAEARRTALGEEAAADPVAEDYEFVLDYTDRRGKCWAGTFRCHIPTIRETIAVGRASLQYRGGAAVASLDLQTFQLTEMLGYLTIVLDVAPPWATGDGLLSIKDPGVLGAIYEEVRGHVARFWGPDKPGKDGGDDLGGGHE